MTAEERKSNVRQQLNTFYEIINKDIKNASEMESIKNIFDKEYTRIKMMADTLREELVYEVKLSLRGKVNEKDKLAIFLQNLGELRITACQYDANTADKSEPRKSSASEEWSAASNDTKLNISENVITSGISGGIAGGILGGTAVCIISGFSAAVLGGVILGAAAGVVIGGGIGYYTDTNQEGMTKLSQPVSVRENNRESKINKEYLLKVMQERKQSIESLFMSYINRWEQELKKL